MANFLVTGAEGAVGREVCRQLRKQEHDIVATDFVGRDDYENMWLRYVDLDLTAPDAEEELTAMAAGADHIIHTAAVVDIGADSKLIENVNVQAVRSVLSAAVKNKVTSVVHISSASIYEPKNGISITEDMPLIGNSAYEISKIRSEEEVYDFCFLNDIKYTVLRPALIYGPHCRYLGASLAAVPTILRESMGNNVLGLRGGPKTNWAHVHDVAAACIHCATTEECYDKTLNICDSVGLGFGDITTMYLEEAGLNVVAQIPLPKPGTMKLLSPIIEAPGVVERLSGFASAYWGALKEHRRLKNRNLIDNLVVKIDREATPYLYGNMVFDNTALKETGFTPLFDHPREGIRQTMKWYKTQGWIW